jgi:hypothetical protein
MNAADAPLVPPQTIGVLTAYRRALHSQLQPAMLALAVLPILVAALVWGLAFGLFWGHWVEWLNGALGKLPWAGAWFAHPAKGGGWLTELLAGLLGVLLYVLAVLVSALMFVSVFGTALMLRHVAADYPGLARLEGGGAAGSTINSLWAVAGFVLLAVLSFPLWFVPVVGWCIPPALLGLLNARVLRYDALAGHASVVEMRELMRGPDMHWRVLGLIGALLNLVPVLWFFSTTLTGLAFIHYALAALAARRGQTSGNTGS